jgi:hypothetical protein
MDARAISRRWRPKPSTARQKFGRRLRRRAVLGKPRKRLWGSGRSPGETSSAVRARRPQRAAARVPDGTRAGAVVGGQSSTQGHLGHGTIRLRCTCPLMTVISSVPCERQARSAPVVSTALSAILTRQRGVTFVAGPAPGFEAPNRSVALAHPERAACPFIAVPAVRRVASESREPPSARRSGARQRRRARASARSAGGEEHGQASDRAGYGRAHSIQ